MLICRIKMSAVAFSVVSSKLLVLKVRPLHARDSDEKFVEHDYSRTRQVRLWVQPPFGENSSIFG